MAKVVNVSVKHIRPKYQNLKEWCEDENNVYIGRKGIVFVTIEGRKERYPKKDSLWMNPYKIGKDGTREQVLKKYRSYIETIIEVMFDEFVKLKGKNLGCWCHPEPCHGNILIEYLKKYDV